MKIRTPETLRADAHVLTITERRASCSCASWSMRGHRSPKEARLVHAEHAKEYAS